jgi:hypothetical protein
VGTERLLEKRLEVGIPQKVVDEQVIDAAAINRASRMRWSSASEITRVKFF